MRTRLILIPVMLVALIFLSGCTGFPDVFGRDVLDVQNVVTKEKTIDAMVIKDIQTIPRSPLLPNQGVVLSFIVENKDDLKTLENVFVDMYNAPLFKNMQGEICNLYQSVPPCPPSECGNGECRILPGEEKPITFELLSPTEKEIVNIRTQEKLDFRAKYDFYGSLLYTVPVVNMDEIINRQRQGERTQVQISKAHGSGPIQIDVELFGAPYILSGYSATFLFKIQNRGSGVLTGKNEIGVDDFVIQFPAELVNGRIIAPGEDQFDFYTGRPILYPSIPVTGFEVAEEPKEEKEEPKTEEIRETKKMFDCYMAVTEGMEDVIECVNKDVIQIYKDETRSSLRFQIPYVINLKDYSQDQPFKSYEIRAFVDYTYELRNSVDVVINPFGNV